MNGMQKKDSDVTTSTVLLGSNDSKFRNGENCKTVAVVVLFYYYIATNQIPSVLEDCTLACYLIRSTFLDTP